MKLVLAFIVWLLFAVALGAGLIRAVESQSWWLLILSLAVFGGALTHYGCRTH